MNKESCQKFIFYQFCESMTDSKLAQVEEIVLMFFQNIKPIFAYLTA